QTWRAQAVSDIREFFTHREVNAANEEANRRAEHLEREAKDKADRLRAAASKHHPSVMEKQLFAVYWRDKGLGHAAIRDKWSEARSRDPMGDGESGRVYAKSAVTR